MADAACERARRAVALCRARVARCQRVEARLRTAPAAIDAACERMALEAVPAVLTGEDGERDQTPERGAG